MLKQLAARKSVAVIAREIETGPRLKRVLSARTLTSIGLGSMIGSGICIGPAIGAAGLLLAPGQPNAGAYAVLALLGAGLAGLLRLRTRGHLQHRQP